MNIYLLAIGARMPAWVTRGFEDYSRRLPRHCALRLIEIPAVNRKQGNTAKIRRAEGDELLARVPRDCYVVALSEDGGAFSTRQLADSLGEWMRLGRDVALLVGGADGLDPACTARADACWSLSALTFPHALVRVIVAEQIYRAWTILNNHPYHRE